MSDSPELSPETAAKIAHAVYGIKDTSNIARGLLERNSADLLRDVRFDFENAVVVGGSSGAAIHSASGFSMVIPGRGVLEGHYVIATRGTVSAYDWMSDFAAAMEPGPGGCAVHAGFNRVAKSVMPDILRALRRRSPSKFHVVGHSLGGAVSNIVAAGLSGTVGMCGGIELYTFGAPRPGVTAFRELLGELVGEQHMFRVFSMSDPVPLVPIFPFLHAPGRIPGALCGSRSGIVNPLAHFMTAYMPGVKGLSWENLRNAAQVTPLSIDELFALAAEKIHIPFVSGGLQLLGRIIGKLLSMANASIGSGVTGGATALDGIAQLLVEQRVVSNPDMQGYLKRFVGHSLVYVGLGFHVSTTVTAAYLAHVLGLIMRPIVGRATTAIQRADQDV